MTPGIRPAAPQDAGAVAGIYNHYILNTIITFEEDAITGADILARMAEVKEGSLPWLVSEQDGKLTGFAYAGKWKGRCAYRYSAETTIYLAQGAEGRGVGSALYGALLGGLRARKLHTALGGIALPNERSVRLHEKLGFQKVAHYKEIGFKFGKWIDVGYWQAAL